MNLNEMFTGWKEIYEWDALCEGRINKDIDRFINRYE